MFSSSKNSLGAKFPQVHFASPQKSGSATAVLIPAGSTAESWENAFRDSLVPQDGARDVPRYPLCCTPEGQELELSKILKFPAGGTLLSVLHAIMMEHPGCPALFPNTSPLAQPEQHSLDHSNSQDLEHQARFPESKFHSRLCSSLGSKSIPQLLMQFSHLGVQKGAGETSQLPFIWRERDQAARSATAEDHCQPLAPKMPHPTPVLRQCSCLLLCVQNKAAASLFSHLHPTAAASHTAHPAWKSVCHRTRFSLTYLIVS